MSGMRKDSSKDNILILGDDLHVRRGTTFFRKGRKDPVWVSEDGQVTIKDYCPVCNYAYKVNVNRNGAGLPMCACDFEGARDIDTGMSPAARGTLGLVFIVLVLLVMYYSAQLLLGAAVIVGGRLL